MAKIIRFDSCAECPFSRDYEPIEGALICPIISAPYWTIILYPEEKLEKCAFKKGAMITECIRCPYIERYRDKNKVKYKCDKTQEVLKKSSQYGLKCPLEEMSDGIEE